MNNKRKINWWCKNVGHLIIVRTGKKRIARHDCLICGYWIKSYMGLNPKLKFRGLRIYKD